MPAGARGHYKIQFSARWHEIYSISMKVSLGKINHGTFACVDFPVCYTPMIVF